MPVPRTKYRIEKDVRGFYIVIREERESRRILPGRYSTSAAAKLAVRKIKKGEWTGF